MRISRARLLCSLLGCAGLSGCWYVDIYLGTNNAPVGSGGSGGGASTSTSSSGGSGGMGSGCTPQATEACYGGPAGTEGVGICKAGLRTCEADGTWGACTGEVVPQAEDCATPVDDDCDGLAPACKGTLLWAKRFGHISDQVPTGLAVDKDSNVLVAGFFNAALDFGGGPLLSMGGIPGPSDAFVAKLNTDGGYLWAKSFGDNVDQQATAIVTDSANNVLIAGEFAGSVDFGGGMLTAPSPPSQSMFVVKLDSGGNHVWSKSFDGDAYAASIAADGAGNVVLGGWVSSTVDFGGGALASAGETDAFVAKLDSNGDHLWSKRFGDAASQSGTIAVDGSGNVILAGAFVGSVDFGNGATASVGLADLFVVKFDASGSRMWSTHWGSAGASIAAAAVAVDASGNPVVVGRLAGSVDIDGKKLVSVSGEDVFVAKLDAGGQFAWGRGFGATGVQNAFSVATDGGGNVLLTGNINGVADFGGGQIVSAGGPDIFVAKLGPDGGYLWARRAGDANAQTGTGVAVDPAGNALITGYLSGSMDFGGGPLVSAGGTDIFVAKFTP